MKVKCENIIIKMSYSEAERLLNGIKESDISVCSPAHEAPLSNLELKLEKLVG